MTPIVEDVPVDLRRGAWSTAARGGLRASSSSPFRLMTSGAYHDAMIMGRRVPVGMIFVPSAGGVSHHPDEYTAPEDSRARRAGAGRERCRGWRPSGSCRVPRRASVAAARRLRIASRDGVARRLAPRSR